MERGRSFPCRVARDLLSGNAISRGGDTGFGATGEALEWEGQER